MSDNNSPLKAGDGREEEGRGGEGRGGEGILGVITSTAGTCCLVV